MDKTIIEFEKFPSDLQKMIYSNLDDRTLGTCRQLSKTQLKHTTQVIDKRTINGFTLQVYRQRKAILRKYQNLSKKLSFWSSPYYLSLTTKDKILFSLRKLNNSPYMKYVFAVAGTATISVCWLAGRASTADSVQATVIAGLCAVAGFLHVPIKLRKRQLSSQVDQLWTSITSDAEIYQCPKSGKLDVRKL